MTAVEVLPQPVTQDDDEPYCSFCGGVMDDNEDHTRLECVVCSTDALVGGGQP